MCLQCAQVEGFEAKRKAKNGCNPTSDIFNSKNKELGLWFFFPEFGVGSVNENEFMFRIPKGGLISERSSLWAQISKKKGAKSGPWALFNSGYSVQGCDLVLFFIRD